MHAALTQSIFLHQMLQAILEIGIFLTYRYFLGSPGPAIQLAQGFGKGIIKFTKLTKLLTFIHGA